MTKETLDPRPDLVEDSRLWRVVLVEADLVDVRVYAILHGFRCMGARLVHGGQGLRMEPRTDTAGKLAAWADKDAYRLDRRRWLVPIREVLAEVFQNAENWLLATQRGTAA